MHQLQVPCLKLPGGMFTATYFLTCCVTLLNIINVNVWMYVLMNGRLECHHGSTTGRYMNIISCKFIKWRWCLSVWVSCLRLASTINAGRPAVPCHCCRELNSTMCALSWVGRVWLPRTCLPCSTRRPHGKLRMCYKTLKLPHLIDINIVHFRFLL